VADTPDTPILSAQVRTEFGKGAARRTRRANQIPAVLYGHGEAPTHLALPSHDTFLVLKDNPNAVVNIEVEGKQQMALARHIQRDPVRRTIEHVDFVIVRAGEKVTVDVPVHVVGESAPGTIHQLEVMALTVTVPATRIPEVIEVDVEGLEDGTVLRVSDIPRPDDATIEDDPEHEVVVISVPRVTADDLAADEASAEAGAAAGAEGGAEEESAEG